MPGRQQGGLRGERKDRRRRKGQGSHGGEGEHDVALLLGDVDDLVLGEGRQAPGAVFVADTRPLDPAKGHIGGQVHMPSRPNVL